MGTLRRWEEGLHDDQSPGLGRLLWACSLCASCCAQAPPCALWPLCSRSLVLAVLVVLSCLICIFLMADAGQHPFLCLFAISTATSDIICLLPIRVVCF